MLNRLTYIFYIALLTHIRCDHVAIIDCPSTALCLENVNWETLQVVKEHLYNSTDPCEDFFDYACGSWSSRPYYDHVDTFGALENNYAEKLIKVLKTLQKSDNEKEILTIIEQILLYYDSCRSSGGYYLEISNYVKELPLNLIFGMDFHWDMMFDANSSFWLNYNWLQTLAELRKYGLNGVFLEESVGFAFNDSRRYVMELKIPETQQNFQSKFEVLEILQEYQLFTHKTGENLEMLANDIYEFDKEIISLYKRYEFSTKELQIINVEELMEISPATNWLIYFNSLSNGKLHRKSQFALEVHGQLKYFDELSVTLSNRPKSLISCYMILNLFKFLDKTKPLITDRNCMLHTSVMFPLSINFINNRFIYKNRKEDELVLNEILEKLKEQFSLYLKSNKFDLSQREIQYLQDKLTAVQLQIGNLPYLIPPLNQYYSSAHLRENNFYHNHLAMLEFRCQQQHQPLYAKSMATLKQQSYYVNDDITALRNAPYFVHPRSLLIVPEMFLQLPFYHHRQHSLMQYSLVGWIMAHELSHSFDMFGLRYDSQGNYNSMGAAISLKPAYTQAMQCLTHCSPPTSTLNERIADVNGLQLIWDVLNRESFSLDIANFTTDFSAQQLFLLNFAQFFCGSLPQANFHDRDDVRVKVTVKNLREFSKSFNCHHSEDERHCQLCDIWRK